MEEDFLDALAVHEERIYKTTYNEAFQKALHSPSHSCEDQDTDEDKHLLHNAWRAGVELGAHLASELCCYYGMVSELLYLDGKAPASQSCGMSPVDSPKRDVAICRTSRELHALLTVSPGLLHFGPDGSPISMKVVQDTFEEDIARIRSKAKVLFSLLNMPMTTNLVTTLSF
ncbi:unnamed protein product [Dicrocoelium dendriticum]|nr:unnamed protein product [Dicrocoelium dendriticum]